MKIVTVIGARPQFIKAAVVSREILKHPELNEIIVHTGQHYDSNMSDVFFKEMGIPEPLYNLGIHGKSHGAMTGQMIEKIENVLVKEMPDMVLVYGDTNSTLAGAIAARKMNIRLAHVEAGLRSGNMNMAEEVNRILTDRISDLLFCPTEDAFGNLVKEGFNNFGCRLYNSGDVMYDAALYYSQKAEKESDIIQRLGLKDFVLCTLHRAENTDERNNLLQIAEALNHISDKIKLVLPLHPRTRKILHEENISLRFDVIDPVGYFDMLSLTSHCRLVITDSGGLQKEAYFAGKYCITLRKETEWWQLAKNGFNILAGCDTQKIISSFDEHQKKEFVVSENFFGEGKAGSYIVKKILELS